MPLIKARTRGKQLVRHITRLDRETNETLYVYAHFLGEPTEVRAEPARRHDAGQGQGVPRVASRACRVCTSLARPHRGHGQRGGLPRSERRRHQRMPVLRVRPERDCRKPGQTADRR